MPKKNWKAPEPRCFPVRVNYTATEHNRIGALANRARTPLAVYIREVSLGTFVWGKHHVATMDHIRYADVLRELHAVGDPLKLLVDLLKDGDDPRQERWSEIEAKLAKAIELLTQALVAM